uniref:FOG: TPR repeat n=1 Tax=uncultured Armatimonadetes bacterium TaxID=157466 RepID=A0A6J4JYT4_9BACT|nr:FOG: TPR repeat [uncultured Armatimonadetes bacterium]
MSKSTTRRTRPAHFPPLRPPSAPGNAAFSRAHDHHRAGRLDEAEAGYREALRSNPFHADALHLWGVVAYQRGQTAPAVERLRKAITLDASEPAFHNNLGNALRDSGDLCASVSAFERALHLNPRYAEAYNNLSLALRGLGREDAALAALRRAIDLKPGFAEAHNNLGNGLKDAGDLAGAVSAFERALHLNPHYAEAYNNLGAALHAAGDAEAASQAFLNALQLRPDLWDAHFNLGISRLSLGDFEHGWPLYEAGLRSGARPPRGLAQPQWDGSPLDGRTLLVHAEQGFGDTLQFVRYLPAVSARGGSVVFECQRGLRCAFPDSLGWDILVERGDEDDAPAVPFDLHVPLLSLPGLFGTNEATIPASVPYLRAEPEAVAHWQRLLAPFDGLKVGIVWAGNPAHRNDRNRSCALADFAPLAGIGGLTLFSLQKGPAAVQAGEPPAGMTLVDLDEDLTDFGQTAAALTALDLVIAVDTSVVHLAGALGKPVWVLLPFAADWRWLRERDDSPWYPTMRLFRQPAPGDWPGVFARVVETLCG